jgi:hypothetical protein
MRCKEKGSRVVRDIRRRNVGLGSKADFAAQKAMSALARKADICSALAYVSFGPKADIRKIINM